MARKLAVQAAQQLPDRHDDHEDPQDSGSQHTAGGDDRGNGDESDADEEDESDDEDDEDDPDGADQLRDKGKKALDRMKANLKAERAKNREHAKTIADMQAQRDSEGKTPDEKAIADARAEAHAEAMQKANARIIRSEVKAAAAGKFRDPADALAFLDLSDFDVDDNGDVDPEDIADALTDLLERKPHLAAQGGTSSFDSARGKPRPKKKLTASDLKGMSPDAINKARREGRIEL